jgi:hypothetical protein
MCHPKYKLAYFHEHKNESVSLLTGTNGQEWSNTYVYRCKSMENAALINAH